MANQINITLVTDNAARDAGKDVEEEDTMASMQTMEVAEVRAAVAGNENGAEERQETSKLDGNNCLPPLNLMMKPVSKYQASPDEVWTSPRFLSHQLGYKLCLVARIQPQTCELLDGNLQLDVGIVSAQGSQDDFLKFPCIGDAEVKILNPRENKGHREIPFGFMINNDARSARHHDLLFPASAPKDYIYKDCLFFHVVAIHLSEDHRPWLLDPGQVLAMEEDTVDSEIESDY